VRTDEVLDALGRERARLLAAVDALGPRASTAFVTEPDGWTAKDVLAHLIHYAGQIAFGLGAQLTPPPYVVGVTERLSGQEWNERAVAHWRDTSLKDVRGEFERIVDLLVERVRVQTDERMTATDTIPWAPGHRLWEFIGHDTFLHEWPAHAQQIERAAGAG
jgi:hypothetical protein